MALNQKILDSKGETAVEVEQTRVDHTTDYMRLIRGKDHAISEQITALFAEHEKQRNLRKRHLRNRLHTLVTQMPKEVRELCVDYV